MSAADASLPGNGADWFYAARVALQSGSTDHAVALTAGGLREGLAAGVVAGLFRRFLSDLAAAGAAAEPMLEACAEGLPATLPLLPSCLEAAFQAGCHEAVLRAGSVAGQRGVAHGRDALPFLALSAAILHPAAGPERRALLEAAILAGGSDALILDAWFHGEIEIGGVPAALDALRGLAGRHPQPTPQIKDLLSRWDRAASLLVHAASPVIAATQGLWAAHAQGRGLDREAARLITEQRSPHPLQAAFLLRPFRQVPLFSTHPLYKALLARAGVNQDLAQQAARTLLDFGSEAWRAVMTGPDHASPEARQRAQASDRAVGYQDRIVADGALTCLCPYDGIPCVAFDSVRIQNTTFYAFRGRHVFYLPCIGFSSGATCLFLPAQNIALTFSSMPGNSFEPTRVTGNLARLTQRLARHPDAFETAVAAAGDPPARREVTVALTHTSNFAHQLWNIYAGLERQVIQGAAGNIRRIVRSAGETEFFGPLANLFPELAAVPVDLHEGPIHDPEPFSRRHILAPIGGYFMSASFLRRVGDAMRRLPQAGAPALPAAGPLVWFGIRVTDKAWIGQEEGIATIIAGVLARHPGAHFVVDGFTFPVGNDGVSEMWRPAIDRMEGVVQEIRDRCGRPERVTSLIGQTLRESVLWAEATDVYLTPIGTTQHKVGWFCRSPGVVYCNSTRVVLGEGAMPGGWEAEGIVTPVYVVGETDHGADGVQIRGARPGMQNLRVDADLLLGQLLRLLEEPGGG